MWKTIVLIAIALSVVNAAEKTPTNATAEVAKTKEPRGKRNLNQFGNYDASRRADGYDYQSSGYNYEPNNYIGGGSASGENYPQQYAEAPEPIIEIIIQDNNETLPAPQPIVQGSGKKKKEQVQVFYVKYHKDEHSKLVIHDPVAALSPTSHAQNEDEYEDEPIIVTPIPQLPKAPTTLRTVIRPDSQQYESDSGVHVTFGSPHNHNSKSDNQIHDEDKVESAIRPIIHLPQNRVGTAKERRSQQSGSQNQGRVLNGPPPNFHPQPQALQQSPPSNRPPPEFNPLNNLISLPNQGPLANQLSLPSQDPIKPFRSNQGFPNFPERQQQQQGGGLNFPNIPRPEFPSLNLPDRRQQQGPSFPERQQSGGNSRPQGPGFPDFPQGPSFPERQQSGGNSRPQGPGFPDLPQGPNFPERQQSGGNSRPQGPGFPDLPQGPNFPERQQSGGNSRPQGPGFPDLPQGPNFPERQQSGGNSRPQGPGFPDLPQGPNFPERQQSGGNSRPQGPGFPDLPQGPNFPERQQSGGNSRPQGPGFPDIPQGPNFPERQQSGGNSRPQGPGFPDLPQGPNFPERQQSGGNSRPQGPGFPDFPQGPSFPERQQSGGNSRPQGPGFPDLPQGPNFPERQQSGGNSRPQGPGFPNIPQSFAEREQSGPSFSERLQGQGFPEFQQGAGFPDFSQGEAFPERQQGPNFLERPQGNIFIERQQQQGPSFRPPQIPLQSQNPFQQQQNILGQPQFNQAPPRLPTPQLLQQQQPLLRPPQRPAIPGNFNQNQKPFNYHAFQNQQPQSQQQQQQVRFPTGQQQFVPNFAQNLQRPQSQNLPPRPSPPQNFNPNRPQISRPTSGQQFPSAPPPNFRPNQELGGPPQLQVQSLQQHNQQFEQQQQSFEESNSNVFRGGLVQQNAPDLTNPHHRPQQHQFPAQQQFQSQPDAAFHREQNRFIQQSFGSDVQVSSSVPKFEHHITETVNPPVFFQPTAVDMERFQQQQAEQQSQSQQQSQQQAQHSQPQSQQSQEKHEHSQEQPEPRKPNPPKVHRFSIQPQGTKSQLGGVSNQFSEVFSQADKQKQQSQSFLELNGRNNFSPEPRETQRPTAHVSTTKKATTKKPTATTTQKPTPSTTKKPFSIDLPDEVPDDLRQQLLSSGILENAQISVLDYDKVGDTSLQDLPPEHLANFFSAGGGTQIGASNKVVSVLKPNGDGIEDKLQALKNDKDIAKILDNTKKLPSRKEDVNLKVVKFDSQSQKNFPQQYIQKDSKILPSINLENNYNRYLPLKINGAQFPIPDVEELRGKKISSVVVLAPVNANEEERRFERDTIETKQIKFIAGDSLKNLLRKPSSDNYKRWLEKEQKTSPDLQSVVLLVTKDDRSNEQEIFMYDIVGKTVNRLSGELSSKFVDVAEENIFDESSDSVDRMDVGFADEDSQPNPSEIIETFEESLEAEPSEIVESIEEKLQAEPSETVETIVKPANQPENKIDISSGYSVIKSE